MLDKYPYIIEAKILDKTTSAASDRLCQAVPPVGMERMLLQVVSTRSRCSMTRKYLAEANEVQNFETNTQLELYI